MNDACKTATCAYTDKGTTESTTYYDEVASTNSTGTGPVWDEASAQAK